MATDVQYERSIHEKDYIVRERYIMIRHNVP